jgi:hypothetical protein
VGTTVWREKVKAGASGSEKKNINIATTCLDVHFWQVLSALVSLKCLLLVPKLQE